jgi:zinc protease
MIRRVLALTVCACGLAAGVIAQTRANWPTEFPPRPLPAREIKFPPYELQTLPNGLQVVAVLHHEQPVVNVRLLVRAGAASDPKEKLGLAHMLASLLDQGIQGATPKTAAELNDTIDYIGGAMGAGAGTDLTFVNMVVMKDSFESGMRMLSDMARHPAFAQTELDRQKQQTLSGLQVSLQDPEYVANSVFDRLVYGFHPYGLPDSGTPQTISSITRDDLVAFHAKYFAPNNAILAIVGDVTAEEAFAAAKKVFADWEKRELPAQKFIDAPEPTRRVVVVNKPDAVQTEVRVGHVGIPRKHLDYMAVNLAIRILGGEGSNRLHQVLRTQRALTYGAQANFNTLKETGDVRAETNTRSDATGEVLRLIVDEFWRLQRERVNEIELADAKAYLTGSFPLTIETPEAIAMQVVNVLFYGLPVDELQSFRERVNAVTVDDIQRVAKAYLRPDRLSVVLVGNAAAFASQLRGVGFPTYETVELGELDLTAANFKRGGTRAPAAPGGAGGLRVGADPRVGTGGHVGPPLQPFAYTPAQQQSTAVPQDRDKAQALLDRVIAAKGGLEKLRGIKTIVAVQTLTSPSPEGKPQNTVTTNYMEYPNRFRIEAQVPGGVVIQGFDGTQMWMQDPRGVHDAPETIAREARASLRRDVVALLLAAKGGALTPRVLPDVRDSAGRTEHALEVSASDLNPIVLYIDSDSGLIRRQAFAEGPGRPLVQEQFSDYRTVDGLQIPFSASRKIGDLTVERRVSDIKINSPIDPALFKRPAS